MAGRLLFATPSSASLVPPSSSFSPPCDPTRSRLRLLSPSLSLPPPSSAGRSSILGAPLIRSEPSIALLCRRRTSPLAAAVLSMLPTAKPERAASGKVTKWSERAVKSFGMAELEARKLKHPMTGTEALLMGILVEGTSPAARFLRANGITLLKVREETIKELGKSDLYFFSPEHPPLTESAQRALDWAVDEKLKSGEDGEITTTHLLLGIWSEEDSAGHKILASIGFANEKASELAKSGK